MSVIIRLQNLPWSANALDIRQFFKGLSIPDGGVHIVGGEMGDAFIAFSTDEDARQAMMRDREKINEVQVRLLLSSRAEMQKVIETARQQSLLALQNASATVSKMAAAPMAATVASSVTGTPLSRPQPPVITASSLQTILSSQLVAAPSFLTYQQQAGITLIADTPTTKSGDASKLTSATTSASEEVAPRGDGSAMESAPSRDRRRSDSRERKRSRSRSRDRTLSRRRRSRSRSKDRDWKGGRRSSRRSRSRERSRGRSRECSRDRGRNNRTSRDRDIKSRGVAESESSKPKVAHISPWNIPPTNAYQTNFGVDLVQSTASSSINSSNQFGSVGGGGGGILKPFNDTNAFNTSAAAMFGKMGPNTASSTTALPGFQNYNSNSQSQSGQSSINNYSLSNFLIGSNSNSNDSARPFNLQNPYTAAMQAATLNSSSQDSVGSSTSALGHANLGSGNTLFPGIFLDKKLERNTSAPTVSNTFVQQQQEPITFANTNPYEQMYPKLFAQAAAMAVAQKAQAQSGQSAQGGTVRDEPKPKDVEKVEGHCVRVSNMCGSTTYSDLRKFFSGLFIPHNGIKMVNDKHGLRVGVAYIQFSRSASVAKALLRDNTMLKTKVVRVEPVLETDFEGAEDSFRPAHRFAERTGERSKYGRGDSDQENKNRHWDGEESGAAGGGSNPFKNPDKKEPYSVLFIEDIPALATEQDIMKMFSSYTIYDILLTSSPENRREYIAHVKFSRDEDAKAAFEDKSHHQIGHRKVRVRPGRVEDMDRAKEKLRLANEQLLKEEQAAAAAAAAEEEAQAAKRRQEEEEAEEQRRRMAEEMEHIESMDLTQDDDVDEEANDGPDQKQRSFHRQSNKNRKKNSDPRSKSMNHIPSLFEVNPVNIRDSRRSIGDEDSMPTDPRLRRQRVQDNGNDNADMMLSPNVLQNTNNFNRLFLDQQLLSTHLPHTSPLENNFIIMKNCDYNTRINDIAQLFLSANLSLKHVEPLQNERKMPTGEFIVEFRDPRDAQVAISDYNNTQFRMRNLRVRAITPQEIADKLGKPFLNCYPGGGGGGGSSGGVRERKDNNKMEFMGRNSGHVFGNNSDFRGGGGNGARDSIRGSSNSLTRSSRSNKSNAGNNPFAAPIRGNRKAGASNSDHEGSNSDNSMARGVNDLKEGDDSDNVGADDGIPEKFNRPGCVIAMENVPFKAELKDILRFFSDFDLSPDDIIRRFNDDGSPTGDARVAFKNSEVARAAFDSRKRKHIFNRTIYLSIL